MKGWKHFVNTFPKSWRPSKFASAPLSLLRLSSVAKILSKPTLIGAGLVFSTASVWGVTSMITLDSEYQITIQEFVKHDKIDDCWVVIHGKVYDLTDFIRNHPGGVDKIMRFAGKDATLGFHQIHSSDIIVNNLEQSKCLGVILGDLSAIQLEEQLVESNFEDEEVVETKVEVSVKSGPRTPPPISHIFGTADFQEVAEMVLPKSTFGYYITGAGDENSYYHNFEAYKRIFFRPKVLIDVSTVDISTEMLGSKCSVPIYITAFAGSRLAHPLAELNLSRGAYNQGIIEMIPTQCSYSFDEFLLYSKSDQNQWYQIHFYGDINQPGKMDIFNKVNQNDNIKGICINVDLAALGNRERDDKNRIKNDPTGSLSSITSATDCRPVLTWADFKKFRTLTEKPIVLKGVQRVEDVALAIENNFQGVILSNHGGRQLDYSRPPIEVLAECKKAGLTDKIEIYVDGGIRRGSDVVKALCLGAKGVGLGRPFLFAMGAYGQEGVEKVVEIIKSEMVRDMKLIGARNIGELNESFLDISDLNRRKYR